MAVVTKEYPVKLSHALVLDEIFDLTLYIKLQSLAKGDLQHLLSELISIEKAHVAFWQKFFNQPVQRLNLGRRIKLELLVLSCRIFGNTAIHMVLEAIEVYGVKKYLTLWESYKGQPLGDALTIVLKDEFDHEDKVVSASSERLINPERVRSFFLGFNDGLVEILGAVSGFFAAFQQTSAILAASLSVAVAGAFSMAAGAFIARSSEMEMEKTENGKLKFLGKIRDLSTGSPIGSAMVVGISYLLGATIPVLPVALNVTSVWPSLIAGGIVVILVSMVLAFLSGMNIARRIATNLIIISAAVGITYLVGTLASKTLGIEV